MITALVRFDGRLRRVYVLGVRVHHGAVGVGMCVAGALLAWHDRRDHRDWLKISRVA